MRPVSYRWNTGIDGDVHYGLIAQETEQAIAEVKAKQRTSIVTHDKETDRYGVRYSELVAPIIKAVQQLYHKLLITEKEVAILHTQKADKSEVEQLQLENEILKQENMTIKARLEEIEKKLK